jgi:hypothetical protein
VNVFVVKAGRSPASWPLTNVSGWRGPARAVHRHEPRVPASRAATTMHGRKVTKHAKQDVAALLDDDVLQGESLPSALTPAKTNGTPSPEGSSDSGLTAVWPRKARALA